MGLSTSFINYESQGRSIGLVFFGLGLISFEGVMPKKSMIREVAATFYDELIFFSLIGDLEGFTASLRAT